MTERIELLQQLINLSKPLSELVPKLAEMEWDSESLIILNHQSVANVLQRYIAHELSGNHIEAWANAIEGRDDISLEAEYETAISEILFELANPTLTQELSEERALFLASRI